LSYFVCKTRDDNVGWVMRFASQSASKKRGTCLVFQHANPLSPPHITRSLHGPTAGWGGLIHWPAKKKLCVASLAHWQSECCSLMVTLGFHSNVHTRILFLSFLPHFTVKPMVGLICYDIFNFGCNMFSIDILLKSSLHFYTHASPPH